MKLRKIRWKNHPVLGNFELNLLDKQSIAYDTIVIAGENGVGKTSILKSLYNVERGTRIPTFIESVEYENNSKILLTNYMANGNVVHKEGRRIGEIKNGVVQYNNLASTPSNHTTPSMKKLYLDSQNQFKPSKVDAVKSSQLDRDDVDGKLDATSIKQLFVDLKAQDDADFAQFAQNDPQHLTWNDYITNHATRISRFSEAFKCIFGSNIIFYKVGTRSGEKVVLFKKGNKEINIDNLSSGECQIVYRGAYLLKNIGLMKSSLILIDEPEISMHPSWQKKILDYYTGLFRKEGEQFAQMIFATHSAGVIEAALAPEAKAKVIVLRRKEDGTLDAQCVTKPLVLGGNLACEINYQAFDIASTDYHNALYGFIEVEKWMDEYKKGKTTYEYVKQTEGKEIKQKIIKSEIIRNQIHHPENTLNTKYTQRELEDSIEQMREFIIEKRKIK